MSMTSPGGTEPLVLQIMKDLCRLARRSRRFGLTANKSRSTARAANPMTTRAATMPKTIRPAKSAVITMATKATEPRTDPRHPLVGRPLGVIVTGHRLCGSDH